MDERSQLAQIDPQISVSKFRSARATRDGTNQIFEGIFFIISSCALVCVGGWFYVCLSMPYCIRIVYFNDDVYCSNVKKIRICLTFNKFLQRTLPSGWKGSKLQFLNCNSFRWCRIRNNQNENKQKNRK